MYFYLILFIILLVLFINKNNFTGYPLFNSRFPISYNPNLYPSEIVEIGSTSLLNL